MVNQEGGVFVPVLEHLCGGSIQSLTFSTFTRWTDSVFEFQYVYEVLDR